MKDYRTWWRNGVYVESKLMDVDDWGVKRYVLFEKDLINKLGKYGECKYDSDADCFLEQMWAVKEGIA